MSRIPLRRLILVLVCLALAMVLGWRGARLSMRAADSAASSSDGSAVEVRERMGADTDEAGSENASGESLADQGETHLQAEVDELGGDAPSEDGEPSGAFVLPDEVEYESDVVLVGLADGVTAADLEALLSETDEIATKKVAADDVASGVVTLEVAEGYSVEDAVNALLGNELIDVVQPNYVYHAMLDEGDLYEVLAETNEPQVETLEPIAVGAAEEDGPQPEQTADEAPAVSEDMGESEADDESAESDEEPAEGAPDHEEATEEDPAQSEAEAAIEEKAEEAPTLQALLDVNDPYSSSTSTNQWALSSIKAYGAWSIARCEGTVTVAVLDQLPDAAHEDLVGNVIATYDAHDTSASSTITNPKNHGTHVAGIVSAVANNETGVAGVSYNAGLLLVNVFSSKLQSSTKDLINAYAWVMDRAQSDNVRVINLSLGGPVSDSYSFTDDLFLRSVEKARAEYGIVTVAAAANADSNKGVVPFREYPGDADNVVSVINLQRSGTDVTRNSTSNYNVSGQTGKNISAPGTDVWSTVPNGSYSTMSGTSMASPQVAGVLALEFAANNNLTAEQAVSILYSSAVDLGDAGWDETYGYGEVDALEAVIAASSHLEGAMVTLEQDAYIYDGTAHEPAVTVTMDDVPLTEGVDYSVAYANNVSAGTGTVTITGKGEYKGFASASFTILPAEIVDADVVLATSSAVYTGKAIRPGLSVTVGGATLLAGTDYTISYQNNVAVGTAQVTVTGKGNYAGTVAKPFEIVLPDLSGASVSVVSNVIYTGFALTPVPTVTLGTKSLVEGRDYAVSYRNNVNAGTASVTITGTGGYRGAATTTFTIVKSSGAWQKSGQRWWYRWSDWSYPISEFVKIGGLTYWFDDAGWMVTGWREIDGSWYWFASSGAMETGWVKVNGTWYWMNSAGKMVTGWHKIAGKTYWMDSSGAMATGWRRISGSWYYFASSGAMVAGWVKSGGSWYWMSTSNGKMATGWVKVGGATYWMKSSGAMATGWQQVSGTWYYFESSGAMARNKWVGNYYLKEDGSMAVNEWIGKYHVNGSGKWDQTK